MDLKEELHSSVPAKDDRQRPARGKTPGETPEAIRQFVMEFWAKGRRGHRGNPPFDRHVSGGC